MRQRRFRSDCEDAQSDLNLRLAHKSEGMFSHVEDQTDGAFDASK